MLQFNDGVTLDTSGDLRPFRGPDGWYVLGEGKSIPVADRAEALAIIAEMKPGHGSQTSDYVHTLEPYQLTMQAPTAFALLRILHRYLSDHPEGESAETARDLIAALKHQKGGQP